LAGDLGLEPLLVHADASTERAGVIPTPWAMPPYARFWRNPSGANINHHLANA